MSPAENRNVIHKIPLRNVKVDMWKADCNPCGGTLKVRVQIDRQTARVRERDKGD
jgi:hypothetical protein